MNNKLNGFNNSIDLLMDWCLAKEIPKSEQNCQNAQLEALKIEPALIHKFYSIKNETGKKIFIQNHHALLVLLSNVLFEAIDRNEKAERNQKLTNIQKSVLLILDNLLVFIIDNFSTYCDKSQKMPNNFQISFAKGISGKVEKFSLPKEDPDYILYEKVKFSIQQRLIADQIGITYGLKTYLDEFTLKIELIRASNKEYSYSITLRDVIVIFNFNALPVIHYLITSYTKELQQIESAKDKIERLNQWLKKVNQVPVIPGYAFNVRHEAINLFLSNGFEEEIRYYEKSLLLFSGFGNPLGMSGIIYSGFKIETEMSVTQIACVVRLFTECGIVKNNNLRELLNFLAEHTRSKKRESISAESLRMKYYNVEESTREEVRKIIFQFLKKINLPM